MQQSTIEKADIKAKDGLIEQLSIMAMETEGKQLDLNLITQAIQHILDHDEYGYYLIYKIENHIVGQLLATYEYHANNGFTLWLASVYVKSEFRKQKIFSKLFNRVEESLQNRNLAIKLYVEVENVVAQKVYESLGMYKTKEIIYEDDFIFHPIEYNNQEQQKNNTKYLETDKISGESLLGFTYNKQECIKECIKQKLIIQTRIDKNYLNGLFFIEYSDWRYGINLWFYDYSTECKDDNILIQLFSQQMQSIKNKDFKMEEEVKCIRVIFNQCNRLENILKQVGMKESHYFIYQKDVK